MNATQVPNTMLRTLLHMQAHKAQSRVDTDIKQSFGGDNLGRAYAEAYSCDEDYEIFLQGLS